MKKSTKTLIAVGVAAAVGGASLAVAGDAAIRHVGGGYYGHGMHFLGKGQFGSMATDLFESVDADGDGTVSQAEIDQSLSDRLAAHDANADGSLVLEEFASLWQETTHPITVRAFQTLDRDGDAIVTRDEFDRLLANIVERLDRDGDGAFSMSDRWHDHRDSRGHDRH